MNILTKFYLNIVSAFRLFNKKLHYYRAVKLLAANIADKTPYTARQENPIIVIGMHRSGTTLTTRLLEDLGISMGTKQGINTSEDLFFQKLNELLLQLSNATWDNPNSISRVLQNQDFNIALTKVITHKLTKHNSIQLSPKSSKDVKNNMWGFKDPRNTYTLPIWLNIFPNAKVINVVRNGQSVVSSLLNREEKNLRRGKSLSLVSLIPSLSLDLWAEYAMTAHKNCSRLSNDKYLEIRYEELLESPETTIQQIIKFLEIDTDQRIVNNAVSIVKQPNNPVIKIEDISTKAKTALNFYGYKD